MSKQSSLKIIKRSDKVINYKCEFCTISEKASIVRIQAGDSEQQGLECVACSKIHQVQVSGSSGQTVDAEFKDKSKHNISQEEMKKYDENLVQVFPITLNLNKKYSLFKWSILAFLPFLMFAISLVLLPKTELFAYLNISIFVVIFMLLFLLIQPQRIHRWRIRNQKISEIELLRLKEYRRRVEMGERVTELFSFKNSRSAAYFFALLTLPGLYLAQNWIKIEVVRNIVDVGALSLFLAIPIFLTGYFYNKDNFPQIKPIILENGENYRSMVHRQSVQYTPQPVQPSFVNPVAPTNPTPAGNYLTGNSIQQEKKKATLECGNCGDENVLTNDFCANCGEPIK